VSNSPRLDGHWTGNRGRKKKEIKNCRDVVVQEVLSTKVVAAPPGQRNEPKTKGLEGVKEGKGKEASKGRKVNVKCPTTDRRATTAATL